MNDENNAGVIPSAGNQIARTETMFYDAREFPVEREMSATVNTNASKPLTQEETQHSPAPTSMSSNDDDMARTSSDISASTIAQHFETSAGRSSGTKGFQFQFTVPFRFPTLPSGELVANMDEDKDTNTCMPCSETPCGDDTIEDGSRTPMSYSGVETENPWAETSDSLGMGMRNDGESDMLESSVNPKKNKRSTHSPFDSNEKNQSQSKKRQKPGQDIITDVGLSMIYSLSNLTDYIVEIDETENAA
jgi:hypothetical protein